MKESLGNNGARNGPATLTAETALLRELGRDLIGVDPSTLSLRDKLRQKRQLANYDGPPIIRKIEPETERIAAYIPEEILEEVSEEPILEESKGPLVNTDTTDQKNLATSIPSGDIAHHFPSLEQEIKEMLEDVNSVETEYVLESPINILPTSEKIIRIPKVEKIKSKSYDSGPSGKYKPVEPKQIEEGFALLIEAVPPEDYHAIRQNPKYNQFLKRDGHRRVLVKISDIDTLLTIKNGRYSDEELSPGHQLLHTLGETQEEKSALFEAASHGRIPAVRKKSGWYADPDVALTYLRNRKLTSDQQRPMTRLEVMRYRDHLKSGALPARKIKNRWHITDEEIRKFDEENPSKRKIEL